jgi:ParB family transcriptional regulator, chromosome partitioning protein
MRWHDGDVRPLPIDALGERYRRYRLSDPVAEEAMARSLRQYGQSSPVVVCLRDEQAELLDGFKRRAAAPLAGLRTLSARVVEADEATAKAAIYGLNRLGTQPSELEEAWIVHALVREDGLTQVQAAELLGHHKSWISRRLAFLERLCDEAKSELRLGLLAPSLARQLTRLPVGNQPAVLATARCESLTVTEVRGVIDLLRGANAEQEQFILQQPREALLQAEGVQGPIRDLLLSPGGNRVARQLRYLLDALGHMENWLRYPGLAELKRGDRVLLTPRFERLARDANSVAVLVADLLLQLQLSEKCHGREATQRDRAAASGGDAGTPDRPRAAGGSDDGAPCAGPRAAAAFGHDADNGSSTEAIVAAELAG